MSRLVTHAGKIYTVAKQPLFDFGKSARLKTLLKCRKSKYGKQFTSYTVSKWFPKHRGFSLFIKKTFFPDAVKHILILSVLKSLLKVQTTCSEQKLINPPILNDMTTADKAFQILLLYSWAQTFFLLFYHLWASCSFYWTNSGNGLLANFNKT